MPDEGARDAALEAAKKYRRNRKKNLRKIHASKAVKAAEAERKFQKKLENSQEWEKKKMLKEREAEEDVLAGMDKEAIAEMKQFRRWLNNEQRKVDWGAITKQGAQDLIRWTKNPKHFVDKVSITGGQFMDASAVAARERFEDEKFHASKEQELVGGILRDWWDYIEGHGKRVKRMVVGKGGVERVVRGRERRKGKLIDGKVVWIGNGEEERMVNGRLVRVAKEIVTGVAQTAEDWEGKEVEGGEEETDFGFKNDGKKVQEGDGGSAGFERSDSLTLPLRPRRLRVEEQGIGSAPDLVGGRSGHTSFLEGKEEK
ncbi:MAG: hypothetical protein Q9181_007723 [Wetmoreana brouardii]